MPSLNDRSSTHTPSPSSRLGLALTESFPFGTIAFYDMMHIRESGSEACCDGYLAYELHIGSGFSRLRVACFFSNGAAFCP